MIIIDGKKISQEIIGRLKILPVPQKIFAAVIVGEDAVSENFLKQKEKIAKELGVDFRIYRFPCPVGSALSIERVGPFGAAKIKNDDLRREVGKIALLKRVGGVIVQLPLPERINKHYILNVIPREKDIDVLGERALGAFYTGRNPVLPPAVEVVKEIMAATRNIRMRPNMPNPKLKNNLYSVNSDIFVDLGYGKIAVVGAGFLIGKPVAIWLMDKVKELGIFEKGSDLSELKKYDLVISGVGKTGLIKPEMLKEGAGIIDFGYSVDESGKIRGDFDSANLKSEILNFKSIWYTPVPGGTGPILTAKVFENFYKLNDKRLSETLKSRKNF